MNMALASKIKSLKPGKPFYVNTNSERMAVCTMAKTLRQLGHIDFEVVTKAQPDGKYKVALI